VCLYELTSKCFLGVLIDQTYLEGPFLFNGMAVPWLTWLLQRTAFTITPVHLGFVVDRVTVGQVFSPEFFKFPSLASFLQHSQLIYSSVMNSVEVLGKVWTWNVTTTKSYLMKGYIYNSVSLIFKMLYE
jgi:hypothetical protein